MSDRKRIAALERDVARLEEATALLVQQACRDKYGRVWMPDRGAWRSILLRAKRQLIEGRG